MLDAAKKPAQPAPKKEEVPVDMYS